MGIKRLLPLPLPGPRFPMYKTKKSDFLIFQIHSSSDCLWF